MSRFCLRPARHASAPTAVVKGLIPTGSSSLSIAKLIKDPLQKEKKQLHSLTSHLWVNENVKLKIEPYKCAEMEETGAVSTFCPRGLCATHNQETVKQ